MQDLHQFFAELHFTESSEQTYNPAQLGAHIKAATQGNFDLDEADIVIIGCGECRSDANLKAISMAPDAVRTQLYQLYAWHPNTKIVDAGNLLQGARIEDTRAALSTVLHELHLAGKTAIVLGGAHDLTLQQYEAFRKQEEIINVAVVDMLIDLDESETITNHSYLLDLLTAQPNYVRQYTHIGFQSYYVPPRMLETLDKLRFDCYRLGKVREHIQEAEPALRNSHLLSFDINAIRHSDAPANTHGSPNGFTGDEACSLMKFAGMSPAMQSIGIYEYRPEQDRDGLTAKQIAQMIWYFIDGYQVRQMEAPLSQKENFKEYHVRFTSNDALFLKSKKTSRWWMQLPNQSFVPCSYQDYLIACDDEIPERWLREQERML